MKANKEQFTKKIVSEVERKLVFGPVIIKPLSSLRTKIGHQINFECLFTGYPRPSIQWFYNNTEIKTNAPGVSQSYVIADDYGDLLSHDQPEVFRAHLSIDNAKFDDNGVYKFTATNEGGSAATSANLIVVDSDAHSQGFVCL